MGWLAGPSSCGRSYTDLMLLEIFQAADGVIAWTASFINKMTLTYTSPPLHDEEIGQGQDDVRQLGFHTT